MKKKANLFVVMALIFSLVASGFSPSAGAYSGSDPNVNDLYLDQASETIFIEGTSYTYDYSYEDNNRTIYVTNNTDNSVEKVSFDEDNSTIYYNDEAVSTVVKDNSIGDSSFSISAKDTWETISSDSVYISWAKGIGTAALAAMIAVGLGFLGPAGVIAAIGLTGLAAVLAGSIGGTIKYKYQRFTPSFGAPYHRYIWSFKASTGDNYGDYIYM